MTLTLVDAHCHLEPKDFPDPVAVISRARSAGVVHAVVVGLLQRPGDFGAALELARHHPDFLSATMGIHPHDVAVATAHDWDMLEARCAGPEVKAVGETGLDYFYQHSPREAQLEGFRRHCRLARATKKPLVVHVRDAHDDCLEVLEGERVDRVVIHCFTGDTAAARRYLDLGCFLSVAGVVTYKKSDALQDAVRFAPVDRLMVETDSPYLAPAPFRGTWPNEPSRVAETAKKVAALKGVDPEGLALACAKNATAFFGLPVDLSTSRFAAERI